MTNRNSNAHFELAPQVAIERSTFDRSCNVKTSFNVGQLVPFFVDEVIPGDTFQIETSKVARLQALQTPIMDNLYLDTYYFFVPNRLVWEHWQEFCGENTTGAWYPDVEYTIPKITFPEGGFNTGTVADYMGIPVGIPPDEIDNLGINALPFRAYALICNEWFRDENLQQPLVISKADSDQVGMNGSGYAAPARGGLPFVANKYHDYFTSCLPAPQKGPDVSFLSGYAPVLTSSSALVTGSGKSGIMFRTSTSNVPSTLREIVTSSTGTREGNVTDVTGGALIYPSNLYADLSQTVTPDTDYPNWASYSPLSINSLRQAFQIQRLYEKDARGGTRYIELLKAHFGVSSPDARLQRPEYLGGNRIPLDIEQVLNATGSDNSQEFVPLGDPAGWSQTNDSHFDVNKSFTEHGYIIGLMCARYDHSYQQGLECMWTRDTRFDFYWPALAHLGEKAVHTSEIYFDGTLDNSLDVFGYQEAWAEYRYKPNYITGQMRSTETGGTPLDNWHFGDEYTEAPSLSSSWIQEDYGNVDRTLAVTSENANQIFADILVKNKCTRPLPLYSIPGLIDHF